MSSDACSAHAGNDHVTQCTNLGKKKFVATEIVLFNPVSFGMIKRTFKVSRARAQGT